jgi:transcriptional regulator with XRE-family HTH domain
MTIGERIKKQRVKLNLTQSDLAASAMVSPQVVSNWEREYTDPDIYDLIRVSKVLKVSTDYLLTGEHTDTLDEQVSKWVEFGHDLKDAGYSLDGIIGMIGNIEKAMKF